MKKGKIIGYIIINHTLMSPEARNKRGISMLSKHAELYPTHKAARRAIDKTLKYGDEHNCEWDKHIMGIYPVREAAK